MTSTTTTETRGADLLERRITVMSMALTVIVFGLAAAVIWIPSFDDPRPIPTVVGPLAVAAVLGSFALMWRGTSLTTIRLAIFVSLILWAVLIFEDDRWSMTIVVIYLLAWSAAGRLAAVLAVAVTATWALSWLADGAPIWTLAIPVSVLTGSFFISWAADRIAADNQTKDDLIRRLESSRQQLADAEHERGALAERARIASEVHDTLAQGFTSIVLLSRVGMRSDPDSSVLPQIEETAVANLDAARRLVHNVRPAELDDAQLPEALRRQLHQVIGEDRSTIAVTGTPHVHSGAIEVTAFRAAQEALLNVRRHAEATSVRMHLAYLDEELAVEITDDGCGFVEGDVDTTGGIRGGQGLQAMRDRVASIGGIVEIATAAGAGTTVSVRLPTGPAT